MSMPKPLFYSSAPRWDDTQCPHTFKEAKPVAWLKVDDASVVRVFPATYRHATFSGVFLLASEDIRSNQRGELAIRVYCRWFGHKLKGGGANTFSLKAKHFEILPSWSGEIVTDLAADN